MTKKIFLRLSLLLVILMITSCSSDNQTNEQSNQSPDKTVINSSAPKSSISFEAYDTDGTLHRSAEWIGKQPVVLNIWGTWCPPCRKEIPDLVKLYDEYSKKGVEIISLAVKDNPQKVAQFARKNSMNWVMLMGTPEIAVQFKASAVPTTIFIDRSGNVMKVMDPRIGVKVDAFRGAQSYEVFKAAFDNLLKS